MHCLLWNRFLGTAADLAAIDAVGGQVFIQEFITHPRYHPLLHPSGRVAAGDAFVQLFLGQETQLCMGDRLNGAAFTAAGKKRLQ